MLKSTDWFEYIHTSEAKRMEFLFELYEKYTADLFTTEKVKKVKKKA